MKLKLSNKLQWTCATCGFTTHRYSVILKHLRESKHTDGVLCNHEAMIKERNTYYILLGGLVGVCILVILNGAFL